MLASIDTQYPNQPAHQPTNHPNHPPHTNSRCWGLLELAMGIDMTHGLAAHLRTTSAIPVGELNVEFADANQAYINALYPTNDQRCVYACVCLFVCVFVCVCGDGRGRDRHRPLWLGNERTPFPPLSPKPHTPHPMNNTASTPCASCTSAASRSPPNASPTSASLPTRVSKGRVKSIRLD